ASTGIIGKILPKQKIIRAIPILIKNLKKNVKDFSTSILTTDTFEKVICKNFFINHDRVSILGIAKGAGMIYPNLATMLGFILTDIDLEESLFKKLAKGAIEESFNSISVDGCRSTNDTVFFLSSRKFILKEETHIKIFYKNLKEVCLELAKMIVRDAEGCSKFIQINVKGAKTKKEAKLAGFSIANSNLFKCAIYGEDPNWGRILSSLGQVGIKVRENFSIKFSSLKKKDILIEVNLKRGNFSWTVYTSDITPKYIELNSCYN
ncbi:MAG: bifunctional ornithine acetyltransferase/N-acetylglutamate synthase, partial [Candidatus Aenigmatarchaeota archaeon]